MYRANPDYENYSYEEVCSIPNFELFDDDIPIWNIDHVKRLIYNAYRYKEIEFETPDRFKNRLNHYLKLRAKVYNDKWKASFLEFDPLVTDYIDERVVDITFSKQKKAEEGKIDTFSKNTGLSESRQTGGTNWEETGGSKSLANKADTMMKGTLFSSAENQEIDNESKTVEGMKTTDNKEDTTETHNSKDVTTNQRDRETGSKDYVKDNHSHETHNDKDTTEQSGTENQTEGNWTEKGTSDGHNLDVSSDTPTPMLFNQPPNIYGTGRSGIKGKIATDDEGNQYLVDYYESDPKQFDFSAYNIGSGESPWFNYASGATNKIGKDSYDKSGTNTYKRDNSLNKTVDNNGNKDINSDEGYEESTSGTLNREISEDTLFDENTKANSKANGSRDTNTDKSDHTSDSKIINTDEDIKQDQFGVESNIGSTVKQHRADANTDGKVHNYGDSEGNTRTKDLTKTDVFNKGDTTRIKKGRSFKSPSALMAEYRNLLTFNPDEWLLAEIRPLFSDLY